MPGPRLEGVTIFARPDEAVIVDATVQARVLRAEESSRAQDVLPSEGQIVTQDLLEPPVLIRRKLPVRTHHRYTPGSGEPD